MCGLVAHFTGSKHGFLEAEWEPFFLAMFMNQLRGSDSTGIGVVEPKGSYHWAKEVGGLQKIVNNKEWPIIKAEALRRGKLLFGHGRAATRGTVTLENAHPFDVEKAGGNKDNRIILIHNGTLSHVQHLGYIDVGKVDSWWMATQIAERGADCLRKIDGAIATMFFDTETNTYNIYRNYERPLFYAVSSTGQLFINSEASVLAFLQYRYQLKFDQADIKAFKTERLYSIKLDDEVPAFQEKELPKMYNLQSAAQRDAVERHRLRGNTGPVKNEEPRKATNIALATFAREGVKVKELINNCVWYEGNRRIVDREALIDLALVDSGQVHSIVWYHGKKTIYWKSNNVTEQEVEPYSAYLVSLIPARPGIITKNYQLSGTTWYNEITQQQAGQPAVALLQPIENKGGPKIDKPIAEPPFRQSNNFEVGQYSIKPCKEGKHKPNSIQIPCKLTAGKSFHFSTTTVGGGVIKHSGRCEGGNARYFRTYSNDHDGTFEIGMQVELEVHEIETRDGKHIIHAFRLKPDMDSCVDFYFNLPLHITVDQIKAQGVYQGTVEYLRAVDHRTHNRTGSYVEAFVSGIETVEIDTDEIPQVVVTQNTENNDEEASIRYH